MTRAKLGLAALLVLPLAAGCSDLIDDSVASQDNAALGDALPGTNATTFAAAKANFGGTETQPTAWVRSSTSGAAAPATRSARPAAPARTSSGVTAR